MTTTVHVNQIRPEGVTIRGELSLAALNTRMNEGAHNDIQFLETPEFEMRILGTPQGAEARGKIRTRYRQPCSRCLKEIDVELSRDVRFIIKPKSSIPAGVNPENDVFVIYYAGDQIDFEEALQENLILALTPYLLPERTPDGACSGCGLKVQDEFSFGPQEDSGKTKLGSLLQQAKSKNAQ